MHKLLETLVCLPEAQWRGWKGRAMELAEGWQLAERIRERATEEVSFEEQDVLGRYLDMLLVKDPVVAVRMVADLSATENPPYWWYEMMSRLNFELAPEGLDEVEQIAKTETRPVDLRLQMVDVLVGNGEADLVQSCLAQMMSEEGLYEEVMEFLMVNGTRRIPNLEVAREVLDFYKEGEREDGVYPWGALARGEKEEGCEILLEEMCVAERDGRTEDLVSIGKVLGRYWRGSGRVFYGMLSVAERHPNEEVCREFWGMLRDLCGTTKGAELQSWMQSGEKALQLKAIRIINYDDCRDELLRRLIRNIYEDRRNAVEVRAAALEEMPLAVKSEGALKKIMCQALKSDEVELRRSAMKLYHLTGGSRRDLAGYLRDTDREVRVQAAEHLVCERDRHVQRNLVGILAVVYVDMSSKERVQTLSLLESMGLSEKVDDWLEQKAQPCDVV